MEMTKATASFVPAGDLDAELAAITATISREEVEEALGSGEPPELFLELLRDGDEHHELSVAWKRDDLERLLGQTDGSAITLGFERDDLERAVDEDVEAHGLRQSALVVTVAAVTAASTASTATAVVDAGGIAGVQPVSASGHDEAGLAERGIVQPGTHDEESLAARGIDPQPVPAIHDEATLVDRGIVEPVAAIHDEASLAARGIEPQPTPGTDGSRFDLPEVDARTAAIAGGAAGGVALLITAAAFATRRGTVRPI